MDSIIHGLNEAQRAAVTSEAKVLQVLAPPGSGKTKVITARVAYLIKHDALLFKPSNIIVCTFTVKAAREMQDRISSFLGKDVASRLVLGTFHSIARRYLAAYGQHIGLGAKFSIADTSDTLAILARIVKRQRFNVEPKVARSRISALKSQGISSEQFSASSKKADQQEIAMIYRDYEEHLQLSNLLDFDDLLVRCVELLRAFPSCVSNIEAVLVDEFQDTNNVQYDLMSLFAQHRQNITIVGDPDQSIYGWRNAEIRNLKRMQAQYPETHVAKLEENYRSSGAILIAAQEIIEQDESRPSKKLMPTHSVGMRPVLRKLPNSALEAQWIVLEIQRIAALTGGLLRWNDFVILLRSASLSRHVESVLGKTGIPYRMVGGQKFFDRLEVKLILDYLRVINHPDHNDAIARVLNVPSRKIGDATLQRLLEEATERKQTLWAVVVGLAQGNLRLQKQIPTQAQKGLELFTNLILTTRRKLQETREDGCTLSDFMVYVIKRINLEDHLRRSKPEDHEARWANVQELVAQAGEFSTEIQRELAINRGTEETSELRMHELLMTGTTEEALGCFLASVALTTDVQKTEETDQPTEQITLSTIHAAKGLEWPVVFIPGAYEGSIPHSRAENTDEERRLLYVAMTRAQCLLYLSCPLEDSTNKSTKVSPFLAQKPMESYLDNCGADIGHSVILELAKILRRQRPDKGIIERALSSCERPKDDLWLPRKYDGGDPDGAAAVSGQEEYVTYAQRRTNMSNFENVPRVQGMGGFKPIQSVYTATSMQQQASYSVSTASWSTTFVSASTALLQAQATKIDEESASAVVRPNGSSGVSQKRKLGQMQGNTGGQNSLLGYFGKPRLAQGGPECAVTATGQKASNEGLQSKAPLKDITNHNAKAKAETGGQVQDVKPSTFCKPPDSQQTNAPHPRRTLGLRRSLSSGWSARHRPAGKEAE